MPGQWVFCHRQIFGRETPNNLTAKSSAIERKRGLQVLYEAFSLDSVVLCVTIRNHTFKNLIQHLSAYSLILAEPL
jgi:hypothetical protein